MIGIETVQSGQNEMEYKPLKKSLIVAKIGTLGLVTSLYAPAPKNHAFRVSEGFFNGLLADLMNFSGLKV